MYINKTLLLQLINTKITILQAWNSCFYSEIENRIIQNSWGIYFCGAFIEYSLKKYIGLIKKIHKTLLE